MLGWIGAAGDPALRRLKLAAEEGARPVSCCGPPCIATNASPAALRLALTARDDGLDVEILKSRGGGPARIERLPIH